MWKSINLLKMIELTADQLGHHEVDDDDLMFAICTASRLAIHSIKDAYELVDKASFGMLGLSTHETTNAERELAEPERQPA
jgi:hypothetical protein